MADTPSKLHVAIIMDGNGRWANARGLPRVAGHQEGAKAVRRVIEAAPDLGIGTLTLYAFSADNWRRPRPEVAALMRLFRSYLRSEAAECVAKGVRISVIGRRDRLPRTVLSAMQETESATRGGTTLHVRLAVDYSARYSIVAAVRAAVRGAHVVGGWRKGPNPEDMITRESFSRLLGHAMHASAAPDVDLLIRTGGEQRVSDFLLWESAYAEFVFTSRMWPDFDREDLAAAVREFHRRERRFGTAVDAVATSESARAGDEDAALTVPVQDSALWVEAGSD